MDASLEGWSLASWNPSWCAVYQADDPVQVLPPEKWLDCANGLASCTYLDTEKFAHIDGTPGKRIANSQVVASSAGATLLSFFYVYSMWDHAAAIYEVGSGPRGAWRAALTNSCALGGVVDVDPDQFAVRVGGAVDDVVQSRVAFGPIATGSLAVTSTIDLAQPLIGQYQGVVEVHLTPTMTAFQVAIPGDIVVGGYPPTTLEVIPRDPEVGSHHAQIVANGSDLVFHREGSATNRAILTRRADGMVVTLYQKPTAWFANVLGDTDRIVWQELSDNGSGGTKNELYAAAWTTDPGQFQAIKVRDLPGGDFVRSAYGEGWFVYFHDDATLRAIRLSDGKYVDVPAPKNFGWVEPRGLVNGEIFATIHIGPPGVGAAYSIARVPIASLGAPKG